MHKAPRIAAGTKLISDKYLLSTYCTEPDARIQIEKHRRQGKEHLQPWAEENQPLQDLISLITEVLSCG